MHTQWPQSRIRSVRLRPEKPYVELSWLDVLFRQLNRWLVRSWLQLLPGDYWLVRRIIRRSDELTALSEQEFAEHIDSVRQQLTAQGINGETLPEAFAMIREAAGRSLGMRHHHTQIRASLILLRGKVAEMATGEGKTLAGTLASSTAAMAGIGVHVITTNDYLAARDREEMKPLYDLLGLSVESVTNESEIGDRQKAYASDITYCTNNELVFDYLKDSLVLDARKNPAELDRDVLRGNEGLLGKLMHRGLNFAIVDEADSVLIDESRTPLVISGGDVEMEDEEEFLRGIMGIARTLHEGEHFRIDWKNRRIFVKPAGVQAVEADEESGSWLQSVRREQVLNQALTALHLFDRDKHYLVSDDKIVIVDEYTGRTAPDRSW